MMGGINVIRDKIELAIEVSRDSGVPVLFLANPGLAKSTVVSNWAARNGFHLETLIGSRFTQEEILGFQVRVEDTAGGQRLELLEPHWYRNIVEHDKKNIPSLLFLDELSTVQENVQGALLQLVFDRTIGHGKKLPASTLVVSAANYKQNIPFVFNIMAPILNRFCLVNLQYESGDSFLDEFLQDEKDRSKDLPDYKKHDIDGAKKKQLRDGLKMMLKTAFESFNEHIDINNQLYNNIYESDTRSVYNFISGRTIHYLYLITVSFLRLGLRVEDHAPLMLNMVNGLTGLGTNTFNEIQQQAWLKSTGILWTKLYNALDNSAKAENAGTIEIDFTGMSASDAINTWTLYNDSAIFRDGNDANLSRLVSHIAGIYQTKKANIQKTKNQIEQDDNALFMFANDMQKIDYLIETNNPAPELPAIQNAYKELKEYAVKKMLEQ